MTNIPQDTEKFLVRLLKTEIDRRDTNVNVPPAFYDGKRSK